MFQKEDFKRIDREYFEVLTESAYHIILKSKNTGHIWDLANIELFPGRCSIKVFHKHREQDAFHVQHKFGTKTVVKAQKLIMEHDSWHIAGREPIQ